MRIEALKRRLRMNIDRPRCPNIARHRRVQIYLRNAAAMLDTA